MTSYEQVRDKLIPTQYGNFPSFTSPAFVVTLQSGEW